MFALVVEYIDYEGELYCQAKSATYKEIRAWVKKNYGLHVSNLAISWTKDRCGLAKARHKEHRPSKESYAVELTPEKETAIREAFIWFGMIRSDRKNWTYGKVDVPTDPQYVIDTPAHDETYCTICGAVQ